MFASALVLFAALASQVSATIFVTEPVASTQCSATLACNVKWNDDGTAPVLATIGAARVDLCVGSQFQQFCLQNISPSTDVSRTAQLTFNPDPNIGQTGQWYFIKFISLAFMDPLTPGVPYTQYSAKFWIGGMTGTWNQTVWQQINGGAASSSAAPVSTPASTSRPAASPTVATVVVRQSTSSSARSTASSSAGASSAAMPLALPGVFTSLAAVTVLATLMGAVVGALALGL